MCTPGHFRTCGGKSRRRNAERERVPVGGDDEAYSGFPPRGSLTRRGALGSSVSRSNRLLHEHRWILLSRVPKPPLEPQFKRAAGVEIPVNPHVAAEVKDPAKPAGWNPGVVEILEEPKKFAAHHVAQEDR